jgi:hypothetical protein
MSPLTATIASWLRSSTTEPKMIADCFLLLNYCLHSAQQSISRGYRYILMPSYTHFGMRQHRALRVSIYNL